jgi:hypothetical protein
MDSASRSNNVSDKHTKLKTLSVSQNFPNNKSLRRCVFMLGADRIQRIKERRLPKTRKLGLHEYQPSQQVKLLLLP